MGREREEGEERKTTVFIWRLYDVYIDKELELAKATYILSEISSFVFPH